MPFLYYIVNTVCVESLAKFMPKHMRLEGREDQKGNCNSGHYQVAESVSIIALYIKLFKVVSQMTFKLN